MTASVRSRNLAQCLRIPTDVPTIPYVLLMVLAPARFTQPLIQSNG